jgi:hypothetical protein
MDKEQEIGFFGTNPIPHYVSLCERLVKERDDARRERDEARAELQERDDDDDADIAANIPYKIGRALKARDEALRALDLERAAHQATAKRLVDAKEWADRSYNALSLLQQMTLGRLPWRQPMGLEAIIDKEEEA